MTLLTIATAVQFVILLGLALVVLSLARQVGILHERLSPAGMTRAREGIEPGQVLPAVSLSALSGAPVSFNGHATALLFVAADCPICRSVLPAFAGALDDGSFQGFWVADGLPAGDGQLPDYAAYVIEHGLDADRLLVSQELGLSLGVRQIPALVLLDSEQRLLSRDTLNGPRQLAALLSAHPVRGASD